MARFGVSAALAIALLALSACATRSALEPAPTISAASNDIPFVLTDKNNLVVDAILDDDTPLRLMLHTAASDVSLTEEAVRRISALRFGDTAEVGSWGGRSDARFSAGHRLTLGGATRENVSVWEVKDSGDGTDGKFGLDFFGERVVVVDIEHGRLRVYDALPPEAADYVRLVAERSNGEWYVEAGCVIGETTHPHRFLLHSGYSGGVLLDDAFAASIGARDALPVIDETFLTDSFGNKIAVRKTVLPGLTLGGARLSDVPAGFFPGNLGNQRISVIGGEIIKRFDLIFDLRQNAIYVRPRSTSHENGKR